MKPLKLALVPVFALALANAGWAGDVAAGDVMYDDGAVAASLTGMAGDPAAGKKVMTTRGQGNCIACHTVSSLSEFAFHGEIGPTLDGAGSRWTEAQLRGIVSDAKKTFDGSMMPSFYKKSGYIRPGNGFSGKAASEDELSTLLTAQQIEDVVAYLQTLKD
ncbi:MAG: sulfur oxidation c-type cytochrome SoxX [Rhodobacteraceae bacterium]|nr:sulfur oxidation c-type cytochrome SoxX [Paracoccaceae bacterium]